MNPDGNPLDELNSQISQAEDRVATGTADVDRLKSDVDATKAALTSARASLRDANADLKRLQNEKTRTARRLENQLPEQHGVRHPRPGSVASRVWEIAIGISEEQGSPATVAQVMTTALTEDIQVTSVTTQYAKWRKFNGIPAAPRGAVAADPAPGAQTPA